MAPLSRLGPVKVIKVFVFDGDVIVGIDAGFGTDLTAFGVCKLVVVV